MFFGSDPVNPRKVRKSANPSLLTWTLPVKQTVLLPLDSIGELAPVKLDEALKAPDAHPVEVVRNELVCHHSIKGQAIVLTSHADPRIGSRVFGLSGGTNSQLLAIS
jgi:hypothetical protein